MKRIAILLLLCLLVPFISGCTSETEAPPEIPAPTPTPVPVAPVESPVIILPQELHQIPITLSAVPLLNENALLLSFEMDARRARGLIPTQGYSMIVVFFAYNIDRMPEGYQPATTDEVRTSGIPYKTRILGIYPDNIITHTEQVPPTGSPSRLFDPREDYVYGAIIDLR